MSSNKEDVFLPMKGDVVVVRNSEILPSDGNGARLWRSGLIAQHFVDNGRRTRWIVASFDHYHKTQRNISRLSQFPDIEGLIVLETPSYERNVSLARFKEHLVFGWKLYKHFKSSPLPSVIICSWPTPESSFFSVLYGKKFGVPVILDIRDKWPDVLLEGRSSWKKMIYKAATLPYSWMLCYSMRKADAIAGVNADFLSWGKKKGGRKEKLLDFVSNIPFKLPLVGPENIEESTKILDAANAKEADLVVAFAGTLGQMFDFSPLHDVVELARGENIKLQFIVCGDGDKFEELKREFDGINEVYFSGRIDSSTVFDLLTRSDVLLACYQDFDNFRNHLPNKFMEYLAAGRPIVSSMQGRAREILSDNQAGSTYSSAEELWEILFKYSEDEGIVELEAGNAKKLYMSDFDPSKIMQSFEKNVDKVIAEFKVR